MLIHGGVFVNILGRFLETDKFTPFLLLMNLVTYVLQDERMSYTRSWIENEDGNYGREMWHTSCFGDQGFGRFIMEKLVSKAPVGAVVNWGQLEHLVRMFKDELVEDWLSFDWGEDDNSGFKYEEYDELIPTKWG